MPIKDIKKIKKFKGTEAEWYRLATTLALSYAPSTYACEKCGYPVIEGYCCTYCADSNPSSKD